MLKVKVHTSSSQATGRRVRRGREWELNIGAPQLIMESFPNPATAFNTIKYRLIDKSKVKIRIYDSNSNLIATPVNNEVKAIGTHEVRINLASYATGMYYIVLSNNNQTVQSVKLAVVK